MKAAIASKAGGRAVTRLPPLIADVPTILSPNPDTTISYPKNRPSPRRPEFWFDKSTCKFVKFESKLKKVSDNSYTIQKSETKLPLREKDGVNATHSTETKPKSLIRPSENDKRLRCDEIEREAKILNQLDKVYNSKANILRMLSSQLNSYLAGDVVAMLPSDFNIVTVISAIKTLKSDIDTYDSDSGKRREKAIGLRNQLSLLSVSN
jgi:hypothetical protein